MDGFTKSLSCIFRFFDRQEKPVGLFLFTTGKSQIGYRDKTEWIAIITATPIKHRFTGGKAMETKKKNILTKTLFIIYLLLLAGVVLFKLPFYSNELSDGVRVINLIPFGDSGNFREIFDNILVFIPLGIYISMLNPKWSFIKKLLPIFYLTLAFEIIQFIFAIGRSDITDVLGNTLGGIIGIGIYERFKKMFKKKTFKIANIIALIATICIVLNFSYLFFLSHFMMIPPNDIKNQSSATEQMRELAPTPTDSQNSDETETNPQVTDNSADSILLVNYENPLPSDYVSENLVNLYYQKNKSFQLADSDIEICESVFNAMNKMFAAAQKDGIKGFIITSGYRTREEQKRIYESRTDGTADKPGHSEHETGLAFDVTSMGNENFELTSQFEWLSEHCAEYGFIIRYPKGKENITGIPYEPWHYRYVGKEHAEIIMNREITLEEYLKRVA